MSSGEARVAAVRRRPLIDADVTAFAHAFAAIGWSKPRSQFERFLAEQSAGSRWVRVAEVEVRRWRT